MNTIYILFLFPFLIFSLKYCEYFSNYNTQAVWNCEILTAEECRYHYQFGWDVRTATPRASATFCISNSSGCFGASTVVCIGSQCIEISTCIPSCLIGKTGGPNGKLCSDFITRDECRKYYADNNGNKWCSYNSNTGICYEALDCHD